MSMTIENVKRIQKAIKDKTENMEMSEENIAALARLENEVISIYHDTPITSIINGDQQIIYQDDGMSDAYSMTYQEYINTLWLNLVTPGGTIYKDDGTIMTDQEYIERSIRLLNNTQLKYK